MYACRPQATSAGNASLIDELERLNLQVDGIDLCWPLDMQATMLLDL